MNSLTPSILQTAPRFRVAMVTNIPAPYRLPVFEQLAAAPGIDFCAFFCSGREPDREWDLADSKFKQVFLREKFFTFRGRFIHANPDLWGKLRAFRPDVVVTTGFNPTHLFAYVYARLNGVRHVAMTDGTLQSETKLSSVHRWIRRRVYGGTSAFIGASNGAFDLYRSYGIDKSRIFKSHLCADNQAFFEAPPVEKRFDFIFCGRFVAIKNPLFAIKVAQLASQRLGRRVSMLFVGSGEMEADMRSASASAGQTVECVFAGFARQHELPGLYGAARILLFPTLWDPWGVVANEACAAGLPVLVSQIAGSAGELIRNEENGFVLPLNEQRWADAAVRLLSDDGLYLAMSTRSRDLVQEYSYENAAAGIADAVRLKEVCKEQKVASPGYRAKVPLRHVVIVQRRMTQYRVPVFELMREQLGQANIKLTVVYGDPTAEERKKVDTGILSWGVHVPCTYFLGGRLCWQSTSKIVSDADLVVITQENKLLHNFQLLLGRRRFKLAFWGHGANLQSGAPNGLKERFKRWTTSRVDWWFAYTQMSADLVTAAGVSSERVTVLDNAVDTTELLNQRSTVLCNEIRALRLSLGFDEGPVGVYVGSLYADKRLNFLFEAAEMIRRTTPNFQLLILGEGPERDSVKAWCASRSWANWVGAKFGRDKVAYVSLAQIMLNPGLVGLGILDSFVCGVPMLTTDCGIHSPEISYLENGVNGVMTPNDLNTYTGTIVELLGDPKTLDVLQRGCASSAQKYTIANMSQKFSNGIVDCLESSFSQPRGRV